MHYYQSGSLIYEISDHLPNYFILAKKLKTADSNLNRPLIRLFTDNNKLKFENEMYNVDWRKKFENVNNTDLLYNIFHDEITYAFNKCFPLVRLSIRGSKDKKWITEGLRTSSKHKNKLYKKWVLSRKDTDLFLYKKYKSIFEKTVKKAKEIYYKDIFDSRAHNLKKIWRNINEMCNPNVARKNQKIIGLKDNNSDITENYDMANCMNDFFCSIGQNLSNKLPRFKFTFEKYLDKIISNSIFAAK